MHYLNICAYMYTHMFIILHIIIHVFSLQINKIKYLMNFWMLGNKLGDLRRFKVDDPCPDRQKANL